MVLDIHFHKCGYCGSEDVVSGHYTNDDGCISVEQHPETGKWYDYINSTVARPVYLNANSGDIQCRECGYLSYLDE